MLTIAANAIPDPDAFFLYIKKVLCYSTCGQVLAMKQARARDIPQHLCGDSRATSEIKERLARIASANIHNQRDKQHIYMCVFATESGGYIHSANKLALKRNVVSRLSLLVVVKICGLSDVLLGSAYHDSML